MEDDDRYITAPTSPGLHPSSHLLNKENWSTCNGLHHAALSGNLKMGKKILDKEVDRISRTKTVNAAITSATLETPLHVAAGAKQSKFVEMLLKEDGIDPTLRDKKGNTAFCSAVVAGAMNIVQIFLHPKIMRREFLIHGGQDMTPLFIATSFGHGDIASTLYNCYQQQNIYMDQNERFGIFFNCVNNDIYDLANILLESEREDSTIAWMSDDFEVTCTALHYLSQKDPSIFANDQNRGIINFISSRLLGRPSKEIPALKLVKTLWKRFLIHHNYDYDRVSGFINYSVFNFLTEAAYQGNFEFLVGILSLYPEAIWAKDYETKYTIIHHAIVERHVRIFKLIHEIGIARSVINSFEDDEDGNNLLHLAAKLPSQSRLNAVSGAALQMRQEILWFKEVENIVQPWLKSKRNKEKQTPKDLFTKSHTNLAKEAEKWMKENAEISLIVATIIVTVIAQEAFNIYGNNNQVPLILLLSNSIAMSSSITSIILFLTILISRFTETELFKPLPCSFIGGIISLFISVTFMMVSFCVTSFTSSRPNSLPYITIALQLFPITLFGYLVFPVLRDLVHSTFFSKYDFKQNKRVLQYSEPYN
ncbi:uncharacterized protein LOC115709161 [Cannabis sativa]|uniref:uncharacterized protein LOC115709161 n=1 Tax=Cannabis sativa TaxID=3483 RepID=UPI0029CA81FF|nr:uncharacterized protein LOC115709161 [Cannabis sativa]